MELGKLPNEVLNSLILNKINNNRKEVLVKPSIGEDCGAVDFGQEICVISTDPITGTENEIGVIGVNISLNDIASSGAEPIGIMVTVLIPPNATGESIEKVIRQISSMAEKAGIDIIGGHTEVTDAVNRFVISITAVGKTINRTVIKTSGAKPGDDLVLTKYAGLEGTSIIAFDHQKELSLKFGSELVINAQNLINHISVIKEGMIAAKHGVHAMHDVTEGGVLGAIWEMCHASGCGAKVQNDTIPVLKETKVICDYYNINPLKLISSGCMLIATENGSELVKKLRDEGIDAAIIGNITEKKTMVLMTQSGGIMIQSPISDELYKVNK